MAAPVTMSDRSASGLPIMTGYQDDPFVDEVQESLWLHRATAIPADSDSRLASFRAAIRAMAALRVTETVSSAAGVRAPALRFLLERARVAFPQVTADRARVPLWDELLGSLLDVVPGADTRPTGLAVQAGGKVAAEASRAQPVASTGAAPATTPEPVHSRLARELRDMTGLSASVLGAAMGVSREQYSRWVSGRPISAMRHGQLEYLHTIARDLVRRLGQERAAVWLRTPHGEQGAPVDLLERRRLDVLHRAVTALPDPSPVVDGTIVALAAPMDDSADDLDLDKDLDAEEAWSPYVEPLTAGERSEPSANA